MPFASIALPITSILTKKQTGCKHIIFLYDCYVKLPVSELFYSIQGEGVNVGMPAFFIRVYGCNLRCGWCDSKYSYDGKCSLFSIKGIVDMIKNLSNRAVILTGGEPSIYSDFFLRLIELAPAKYFMETNGTIWSAELARKLSFVSVSPKLSSSGEGFNLDIIQGYIDVAPKAEIKFVISDEQDIGEAVDIIKRLSLKHTWLVFQPVAVEDKNYPEQIHKIYKLVSENRFLSGLKMTRFIPQVHKLCNIK